MLRGTKLQESTSELIYAYQKIKISKRNGKFRIIYRPNSLLKKRLTLLLKPIHDIYKKNYVHDCDHAFFSGRNCVTNASQHINNRYVLSMDMQDFFNNITSKHLINYLPNDILRLILVKNSLPQGYPTSPYVANIAMIGFDKMLIESLHQYDSSIVYSRYADDLTFSFNNKLYKEFIMSEVIRFCHYYSFKINSKKTKFQDKNNGRAIITGVGVSYHNIHSTRKTLKKLRAARHQNNEDSANGLAEWAACKVPNPIN